jgi:predicted Zn finger-like uncharacterized protein
MEIKCPACQTGFRIPDNKIPQDRDAITFSCPKCTNPITIDLRKETKETADSAEMIDNHDSTAETMGEIAPAYDAREKPFEYLEKGQLTALICESDPDMAQQINQSLEKLDFTCALAESTLVAIKYMRYHVFDLIVLNEAFDGQDPKTNPIRLFLSRLPMTTRRNMFITLLTRRFRTMDNMAAYNLSVNQVVHEDSISEIEPIIRQGIDDNNAFYSTFKKVLVAAGEADAA